MKKTIKTADLMEYLNGEILAYEAAAEKFCRKLDEIERGEYKGRNPIDKEKKRLTAHWELCEHNIGELARVKQHVAYHLAKED